MDVCGDLCGAPGHQALSSRFDRVELVSGKVAIGIRSALSQSATKYLCK
jgi:hypothetical protein